jgi:signal transduction histidine kinase
MATAVVTAVGVASEASELRAGIDVWLTDLAAGLTLAVSGAVIATVRPRSRLGILVWAAALAWFIPNFAASPIEPLSTVARAVPVLHRAVLFHAVVSFPDGRVGRFAERAAVGVAYLTVLGALQMPAIAWSLGALVAFGAIVVTRSAAGRDAGVRALPAMALLAAVVGGTAALFAIVGNYPGPRPIVHLYEAGIAAVGVVLAAAAVGERSRGTRLAGAAVELTQGRAGYVRELLADALRDPSVEVAFAIEAGAGTGWVDELGRPIAPLRASGARSVIPILVDGNAVAQLACDARVADEPAVRSSLEAAARLAARNARLRAGLRSEAEQLRASRLRLLSAADDQRIALAQQLARGAGTTILELDPLLDAVPDTAERDVLAAVERSRERVAGLAAGLRSLSAGLGPANLRSDGLERALSALGEGFDGRLEVEVRAPALPDRLASTAWFIAAEGITNAVKHAQAATTWVTVEQQGRRLLIRVEDDGVGGASADAGTGLQGLSDRVAALGGSMSLVSPPGEGTRLSIDLPVD